MNDKSNTVSPIRVGIMGAGGIAHVVAKTLVRMENIVCHAIASRNIEKAEKFRQTFGFTYAYGSYEALVNDTDVDLVYVAVPHSVHEKCMMLCLEHKKPVLCEKPFTVNYEQAKRVINYANAHKVFVAEAMWTRYLPSIDIIKNELKSGIIGKPKKIFADLSYKMDHVPRILNPELGGGALLDIGIYGINFALMFFGDDLEHTEASFEFTETRVDAVDNITLFYRDGRKAVLRHSIYENSDKKGIIYGDKGYIAVNNIVNPSIVEINDYSGKLLKRLEFSYAISGYAYEFEACANSIRTGECQVPQMTPDSSVKMMEIIEQIKGRRVEI